MKDKMGGESLIKLSRAAVKDSKDSRQCPSSFCHKPRGAVTQFARFQIFFPTWSH